MKKGFCFGVGSTLTGGALYWNYLKTIPKEDRLNITFDIDYTLIKSRSADTLEDVKLKRKPDFTVLNNNYYVWVRPFSSIVKHISKVVNVHVFTAAKQNYADEILDNIYKDENIFDKKLYRKDCDDLGKDLKKISNNLEKTILIDDKLYNKYDDDQKFYHIPQYHSDNTFDFELVKVFVFVMCLCVKEDIKRFRELRENSEM